MKVKTRLSALLEGELVQFEPHRRARQQRASGGQARASNVGGRPSIQAPKAGTKMGGGAVKTNPPKVRKRTVGGEKMGDWRSGSKMAGLPDIDRDEAIKRIRAGLKKRTGRSWSVKGGRGTAWGWIEIDVPPKRTPMSQEDSDVLHKALGLPKERRPQYISVAADSSYRIEYVDRAEGRKPRVIGKPYWD